MAYNAKKTERAGPKKGAGAYYGHKSFAKKASARRRRENDKHELSPMAHHKRKRPKNRRAGCLLCKPWKMNGFAKGRVDAESLSDHRRRFDAEGQLAEARVEMFHTGIRL
jgi:hypothetical protein